jgi:hypothetical protein
MVAGVAGTGTWRQVRRTDRGPRVGEGHVSPFPARRLCGTVLAVKGSLRRACGAPLTAAGRSNPLFLSMGKGTHGNCPVGGGGGASRWSARKDFGGLAQDCA